MTGRDGASRDIHAGNGGAATLKSWKEIATFLRVDERTAKRWEVARGLPIHRPPGQQRAVVHASRDELNDWLLGTPETEAAPPPRRVRVWLLGAAAVAATGGAVALVANRPATLAATGPAADVRSLYMTGMYHLEKRTPGDLRIALDAFQQATARNPGDAASLAGLAETWLLLREYGGVPDPEAYARATAAAKRALALDPNSAQATLALAFATFHGRGDFAGGLALFDRAVALDPASARAHHWRATALLEAGRSTEALAEIDAAQARDPASRSILADRELIRYMAGRRADAKAALTQLAAAEPDFVSPRRYLALIASAEGDAPGWLARTGEALAIAPDATAERVLRVARSGFAAGGARGMAEAVLAERLKLQREGGGASYDVAAAYAALDRRDEALRWLALSLDRHEILARNALSDSRLAMLRSDPRFAAIAARVGRAP